MNLVITLQKFIFQVLLLIIALPILSCGIINRKYEKIETGNIIFSSDKKSIVLHNIDGNIFLKKNLKNNEIIIEYEKRSEVRRKYRNNPIQDVKIEIDSTESEIKIKSVYTNKKNYKLFSSSSIRYINYTLYLPEGIFVKVNNVNGKIVLEEINNELNVELVNGEINLNKTIGPINLKISNGDLTGTVDSTKGINCEVINGKIKLGIGEKFSGIINADVTNGKIDFEDLDFLSLSKDKKFLQGKLGESEAIMKLSITNGKIKLFGNKYI